MENRNVFDKLMSEAKYALASFSRDLVYETYGAAKMAYNLDAITKEQFYKLNEMLVRDGLNNPAKSKLK